MFDYTKLPSPKGQVELIETIGKGNFGYVYRGRLTATKELSAVKVVQIKQEELREILLEVEILTECHHENIVKFQSCYLYKNDLWICMEFCGGGAVDSLYKNLSRQLTEEEVGIFILETMKALDYLHKIHIIHRDIKTGNLLLAADGNIKLADFGVSAQTTSQTSYRAHSFIGTPYWMAPEVIMSENLPTHMYDCKADIWSVGIMTIELADKSPPLSDIHPMRALYLIPTADANTLMVKNVKAWSKPFIAFIQSCLVKDPKKRPSAGDSLKQPFMTQIEASGQQSRCTTILKLINHVREEKKRRTLERPNKKAQPVVQTADDDSDEEHFDEFTNGPQPNSNQKKSDESPPVATSLVPPPIPKKELSSEKLAPKSETTSQISIPKSGSQFSLPKPGSIMSALKFRSRATIDDSIVVEDGDIEEELFDITPESLKGTLVDKDPLKAGAPQPQSNIKKSPSKPDVSGIKKSPSITEQIANLKTRDNTPFQLVALDLQLKLEVLCSDIVTVPALDRNDVRIDFQFMLMGTEKGLVVSDITHHHHMQENPKSLYLYGGSKTRTQMLLANVKFKQVQVLEDYSVVVAVAGKSNQMRTYQLATLRKLIRFVYNLGVAIEESDSVSDERLAPDHDDYDVPETPAFWASDYEKILESKDTSSFVITRTKNTVYLGAIVKTRITIYEWAKLPYLRFMKVKDFWAPEAPKGIHIMHDGKRVRDLIFVYEREANYIEFESSQVKEIEVPQDIAQKLPKEILKDKDQARWFGWMQLMNEEKTSNAGKQQVAVTSWYDTMKNMKPSKDDAEKVPRYFLATYGNQTRLVDEFGVLKKDKPNTNPADSIEWSKTTYETKKGEDPLSGAAATRVAMISQNLLGGCHKNYFEICNFQTGDLAQALKSTTTLRLLGANESDFAYRRRGRVYLSTYNKKKKTSQIYWLKETGYDVVKSEAEQAYYDKILRNNKVLGTGTVLKGSVQV